MNRSDAVLALIDAAVEDWTVSEDAMRSRPPDEPRTLVGFWGVTPTVYLLDEADELIGSLVNLDWGLDQSSIDPVATRTETAATWHEVTDHIARTRIATVEA